MQNNPTEVSRVDDLLALLGDLSQRDTSPAVRAHLSDLSSQRFQQKHVISDAPRTFTKLSASFAFLLLAALGLATAWVVHLRQPPPKNMRAGNEETSTSIPMPLVKEAHVVADGSSS